MSKSPIHLDKNAVAQAVEDHKSSILELIDDPKFRSFWEMMGGEPEFLDEKKVEVEKWEVK